MLLLLAFFFVCVCVSVFLLVVVVLGVFWGLVLYVVVGGFVCVCVFWGGGAVDLRDTDRQRDTVSFGSVQTVVPR